MNVGSWWSSPQRLADLADAHLQHRVADEDARPQAVEELVLRHQLAGARDEQLEDAKGFGRHRDRRAAALQRGVGRIEAEVAEGDDRSPLAVASRRAGADMAWHGSDHPSAGPVGIRQQEADPADPERFEDALPLERPDPDDQRDVDQEHPREHHPAGQDGGQPADRRRQQAEARREQRGGGGVGPEARERDERRHQRLDELDEQDVLDAGEQEERRAGVRRDAAPTPTAAGSAVRRRGRHERRRQRPGPRPSGRWSSRR